MIRLLGAFGLGLGVGAAALLVWGGTRRQSGGALPRIVPRRPAAPATYTPRPLAQKRRIGF